MIGPPPDTDPTEIPDADENYDPREVDSGTGKKPTPPEYDPEEVFRTLTTAEMRVAAKALDRDQARYIVSMYYTAQGYRIASNNQVIALAKANKINDTVRWLKTEMAAVEGKMQVVLGAYARTEPSGMGRWALGIMGIGPILSAAYLAYLDIAQAPTVGHFWRFGGVDPTIEWLGTERAAKLVRDVLGDSETGDITLESLQEVATLSGRKLETVKKLATTEAGNYSRVSLAKGLAKRPWNADLKVVIWKTGESFVKVQNNPLDIYGHWIVVRKAYEQERNERGDYAGQAEAKLKRYNIGKDTDAYQWYSKGKLPPGHIHARCKRYAAKLFMAHWWEVAWLRANPGKKAPLPYPIAMGDHTHKIEPPNAWLGTLQNKGG